MPRVDDAVDDIVLRVLKLSSLREECGDPILRDPGDELRDARVEICRRLRACSLAGAREAREHQHRTHRSFHRLTRR